MKNTEERVIALTNGAGVAPSISHGLHSLDLRIVAALSDAKEASVPQGLIVAILQAHLFSETREMLE